MRPDKQALHKYITKYIINKPPLTLFFPTQICIATASPAKFEEAVTDAGLTPQPTEAIKRLDGMPQKYTDMKQGEDWEAMLRAKIVENTMKYGGAN